MSSLGIPRRILDEMVLHARRSMPQECCGLLAAREGVVMARYPIENALAKDLEAREVFETEGVGRFRHLSSQDAAEVGYVMDARELLAVFTDMRRCGNELAAIYHSHPRSRAYPSPTDTALAYYSDCLYIIVSLSEATPEIRAFWIRNGQITQASYAVL